MKWGLLKRREYCDLTRLVGPLCQHPKKRWHIAIVRSCKVCPRRCCGVVIEATSTQALRS